LAVQENSVRIIGGHWRGRRLRFPARPGLRPTPDRVRETLFNWLAKEIPEAQVLDLFAGSGALGFEAASRGAGTVVLVERDRAVAEALRANAAALGAGRVRIECSGALEFLSGARTPFDIVFVDPPYRYAQRAAVCDRLDSGWLTGSAFVYLETASADAAAAVPARWQLHRETRAGAVAARLYQARSDTAPDPGFRQQD
jgi:16S rRNA (guanine966-N2)-methyltransferase